MALTFIAISILAVSTASAEPDFKARSQEYIRNNMEALRIASEEVSHFVQNMASAHPSAAAPPVTSLEFTGITSSMYPYWEDIQPNQTTTVQDHGGTQMYIEIVTIGYGIGNAKINSIHLKHITSHTLVNASNIVYGFIDYYNASGYQGGNATTQSTSQNYPYNIMTDFLYIK